MTFIVADRVQETTNSPGTGTATLLGAVSGYQSFSTGVGINNTTFYVIADQLGTNWEVGLGALNSTGTVLTRTTVYSSSNGGSTVNFATGIQYVWCDYPSSKAVIQGSPVNFSSIGATTAGTGAFTTLALTTALSVANGGTGVTTSTGSGSVVLSTSPTLVTPLLGTPSSGTVTNLTGTASININGTVGATTASTGVFTTATANSFIPNLSTIPTNGVYLPATNSIGIATNSTNAVTIDASQNVGIGVTPSAKLDVAGAQWIRGAAAAGAILVTTADPTSGANGVSLAASFATGSYGPLKFFTSNTEAMRIDSSGNVGIGTVASASTRFQATISTGHAGTFYSNGGGVALPSSSNYGITLTGNLSGGSAEANIVYGSSGAGLAFNSWNGTTQTERMRIVSSGKFGVGLDPNPNAGTIQSKAIGTDTFGGYNSAGGFTFAVSGVGQIYAVSTSIAAISDERLKENIRDLNDGLQIVMALKPRKYDWKAGKGADTKNARGFIAQEFEQILPDLIDEWREPAPEGEAPYKSIRQDLFPILVKAIQELNAKVTALEEQLGAK